MGRKVISSLLKNNLLFSALFTFLGANAQTTTVPTAVSIFYNGITAMYSASNSSTLGQIEMEMRNCFYGKENSGINMPNDFRFFENDKTNSVNQITILTSNNYVNKLSSYMYPEKRLEPNVSVSTYSREVGSLPNFSNGKMTTQKAYVETIVQKTYSIGQISKTFMDTVYTHVAYNKIMLVVNGNGISTINPDALRVEAAKYYMEKNYKKAYEVLLKIVDLDRTDGDSYYRLALMTYYGRGCKRSRKDGERYLDLAIRNSDYDVSNKLYNVQRYWKYPNQ